MSLLKFIPTESERQRIEQNGVSEEMDTGTVDEFQNDVNSETVEGEQEDMPISKDVSNQSSTENRKAKTDDSTILNR